MTTVTFTHPHIGLIADAGDVRAAARTGHWSIAADLCADKAVDLAGQRRALDNLARTSGLPFADPDDAHDVTLSLSADTLTATGDLDQIRDTLDLYARILCGQWLELAFQVKAPSRSRRVESRRPHEVLRIRQDYGRVAAPGVNRRRQPIEDNEWPEHPDAYISIAAAVLPAQVAYHAYKALGGGTQAAPTFTLPEGPISVQKRALTDRYVPGYGAATFSRF